MLVSKIFSLIRKFGVRFTHNILTAILPFNKQRNRYLSKCLTKYLLHWTANAHFTMTRLQRRSLFPNSLRSSCPAKGRLLSKPPLSAHIANVQIINNLFYWLFNRQLVQWRFKIKTIVSARIIFLPIAWYERHIIVTFTWRPVFTYLWSPRNEVAWQCTGNNWWRVDFIVTVPFPLICSKFTAWTWSSNAFVWHYD